MGLLLKRSNGKGSGSGSGRLGIVLLVQCRVVLSCQSCVRVRGPFPPITHNEPTTQQPPALALPHPHSPLTSLTSSTVINTNALSDRPSPPCPSRTPPPPPLPCPAPSLPTTPRLTPCPSPLAPPSPSDGPTGNTPDMGPAADAREEEGAGEGEGFWKDAWLAGEGAGESLK